MIYGNLLYINNDYDQNDNKGNMKSISSAVNSNNKKNFFSKMRIGTKVSIVTMLVFGALFVGSNMALRVASEKITHDSSIKDMSNMTLSVVNSLDSFDRTVGQQINRFADLFATNFSKEFEIDESISSEVSGKKVPTLKSNGEVLNLNFQKVDEFTQKTGVNGTIFVKSGDEYIRISTSVKNDKNERAIGTNLLHSNPAYEAINKGQSYNGVALIFGKYYTTSYRPLKNKSGEVIGIMFAGLDVSEEMQALKDSIKKIKVGKTGYVFIVDANEKSTTYGSLLVHPDSEGKNIVESNSNESDTFIKEILQNKKGQLEYQDRENDKEDLKEKIVAYETYDKWDWAIVSGTYLEELTGEMADLYHYFTIFGFLGLLVLNFALYVLLKHMVTKPLMQVMSVANTLASGDLTINIETKRQDEIGELYESMNNISDNLSKVVTKVRVSTDHIQTASSEIAAGNLDLSARTEQQAASLEETATSMEQLTVIIKNNAEQAMGASTLVTNSSKLALKGGESMKEVVSKMEEINDSSKKIVDIIAVIDSIAFQTNILALNAAVEAARAGEQGRGFAVVASEVRSLAQRSASAAKEIKELISTSVSNISEGNSFVLQAENTIKEIVTSVDNVSSIMKEIAQANHEQSIGVGQINIAISQMDGVTQQNAALVEQAASAAASMQELSVELTKTVESFKTH